MSTSEVGDEPTTSRGAILRDARFVRLWLAQFLSLTGDAFFVIAFTWLALGHGHSPSLLGAALALQAIPRIIFTFVGGDLADRRSPVRVMQASALTRVLITAWCIAASLFWGDQAWLICVIAFVFGIFDALFQPARMSVLPSILTPEELERGNSLLAVGSRVAAVVGPPLAGILLAATSVEVALGVDAVSFLCVGLLLIGFKSKKGEAPAETDESFVKRLKAGVAAVTGDARIRTLVMLDMAVSFCYAGPFLMGFALLARIASKSSAPMWQGFFTGSLALGSILGALLAGIYKPKVGLGTLIGGLCLVMGLGMTVMGLSPIPQANVAVTFIMGIAMGYEGVYGISWIQRNVSGGLLSRVIAIDMVAGYAAAPVATLYSGWVSKEGPMLLFVTSGILLVLVGLLTVSMRATREMSLST